MPLRRLWSDPLLYVALVMPSHTHTERCRADLQRFLDFGGSNDGQRIRPAFAVCLDSYCRPPLTAPTAW